MHARVTMLEIRPDKWEAMAEDRGLSEQLEMKQGFKGAYFLQDRETRKAINITLWETEEDMKATEASGWYQEAVEVWKDTFASPPVTEHYEVGSVQGV